MKKTIRILLPLLLSSLLLLLLPGCQSAPSTGSGAASSAAPSGASSAEPGSSAETSDPPPTTEPTPQPATPAEPDPEPELPAPTEVRLLLTYDPSLGSTEEGRDRVGAALSALAEPAAGLPVSVTWVAQKEAASFLAAATAEGQVFDLYMGGADAAGLEAQGLFSLVQATRIEENAPDFIARMEPYIRPLWTAKDTKNPVEHAISLFPLYKPVSEALYMDFRADLCEAAGYTKEDVAAMTDWNQVYFLLKDAKAAAGEGFVGLAATRKNDRYGSGMVGPNVICCGVNFSDALIYDNLGDTTNLIAASAGESDYARHLGILFEEQISRQNVPGYAVCPWLGGWGGNSPNPESAYSCVSARRNALERMEAWMVEGLIWPDSGTDMYPGSRDAIFARIYRASELTPEEPDRYRVKIVNTLVTAQEAVRGYFAIPASARAPEAALRILNLVYAEDTAGKWADLMVYGQAGTDYEVGEDGRLTLVEGAAYRNAQLGCSSLFLSETVTEEPGARALQTRALEAMHLSPNYGFTADTKDSAELIRSLRSLAGQYIPYLTWGSAYASVAGGSVGDGPYDHTASDFAQALLEAGIGEYMKLLQSRLDVWKKQ